MTLTTLQFWRTYRDSLIQQYRAAGSATDILPAGFDDAVLGLIRCVERHINEGAPDGPAVEFNPGLPPARVRRGRRGVEAVASRLYSDVDKAAL